jgi:hypothetical protein
MGINVLLVLQNHPIRTLNILDTVFCFLLSTRRKIVLKSFMVMQWQKVSHMRFFSKMFKSNQYRKKCVSIHCAKFEYCWKKENYLSFRLYKLGTLYGMQWLKMATFHIWIFFLIGQICPISEVCIFHVYAVTVQSFWIFKKKN